MSDSLEDAAKVHPGIWLECFARILTKTRDLVRPQLNIFQARAIAAYIDCINKGIAPRLIGLKPRQVGGTTVFAGISYHHGRRFNSKGIVMADVMTKSDNLFQMLTSFAQNDDLDWGCGIYDPTRLELKLRNGTEFYKRSADTPTASRSDTLQIADMSEAAYWKDTAVKSAKDVMIAVMNALASHATTFGGMESTPAGAMGMFYEHWCAARWPEFDGYWKAYSTQPDGPGNGWIRIFAGWHEFPEHTESVRTGMPITERQVDETMASLDDDEKNGMKLFGWTVDQMLWRRWTIANRCLGEVRRFYEEYPTDPENCFLSSGSARFDTTGVTALLHRSRSVRYEHGLLAEQNGNVIFQATSAIEAMVWIWEHAKVGCRYLISIDTMSGESDTTRGDDLDNHSVIVWRDAYKDQDGTHWEPREVARIKPPCQFDNKPLAELVALLSRYYGTCVIIPETNCGFGLITHLREMHVPIFRMVAYDKAKQKAVDTMGWNTNEDRRRDIIDNLATRIREQSVDIADSHMVSELQTFIRQNGRSEAMSGRKDDDVLSAAIGLFNLKAATELQETVVERKLPADYYAWKRN